MKRLLAWFLILCMLFSFVGCEFNLSGDDEDDRSYKRKDKDEDEDEKDDDDDEDEKEEGPLMYKITDEDGNVLWLFGSIHLGRKSFYPLPDYVMDAYESADVLAVEFDVVSYQKDTSAMMKDLKKLVYTDGTTLEDHVSSDLYDQCVAIMKENNSYNKSLDSYSVVMWSQLVDSCTATKLENDGSEGIDVYLLNLAHEDGKEIQDIESSTMQYQMLMSFSEPLQELMLEASVNNYYDPDGYLRSVDDMMDIWQEGDPDDLEKLISGTGEFDGEDEEELFEEYFDTMFRQRNVGMADFAEDALESGDEVFICVGAGHIVGHEGVAELLEDRGYTVEVVY